MGRKEEVELTNMCMICDKKGNVLVQDKKNHPTWHGWNFPGGHVEQGEYVTPSVIREMKEETGLTICRPRLCGVKQFPIEGGRYLVFLFETEAFEGELRSSDEGEMRWISRSELKHIETVDDLETMVDVMLSPSLTEFQYLVNGGDWTVQIR